MTTARQPQTGEDNSEDDVEGYTLREGSRSHHGGTATEPVVIDSDEDDFDVFGPVVGDAAEGSRAAPARAAANAKAKGKGKKIVLKRDRGERESGLLGARNDIPLFYPASDTDMEAASPLPPLSPPAPRRRTVQEILAVEIPLVPQEVLDQYTLYDPPAESLPPSIRPSQIPLPPTPPMTAPGQYEQRPLSTASTSEAEAELQDGPEYDLSSPYPVPPEGRPEGEDEAMPYEDEEPPFEGGAEAYEEVGVLYEDEAPRSEPFEPQLPSPAQSSPVPGPSRRKDRSSSDPIAAEWESRAPTSEAPMRDEDEEGEAEMEEEEEGEEETDYDDSEEGATLQVKQRLRGYDERREASKLALKQRLRGVPSNTTSRALSVSSPIPSAISISSGQDSNMAPSKRPPKRKIVLRKPSAVGSVNSDSPYNEGEGEDEIEEIPSSEFEDGWDAKPRKSKGKAKVILKIKGGKKRNSRQESEDDGPTEDDILSAHRETCEKCRQGPAGALLAAALKKKKRGGKKRKRADEDDEVSEDEAAEDLEGWLECERCVTVWHWGCLGMHQQQDALQFLERKEGPPPEGTKKRKSVKIDEFVTFECRKCIKTPNCMVCHQAEILPEEEETGEKEVEKEDGEKGSQNEAKPPDIQFRCVRCTQSAHYEHLPDPFPSVNGEPESLASIAEYYQKPTAAKGDAWTCHQCRDWIWKVDMVIAWRPFPAGAVEEDTHRPPSWNADLPREYLIKFIERGFRHSTWVPHSWLKIMASQKLRNFLEKGPVLDLVTDGTLAAKGDEMTSPTIAKVLSQHDPQDEILGQTRPHHLPAEEGAPAEWRGIGPAPDVNGKTGLPIAWSTIDRVLDIYLTPPPPRKKNRSKKRISSESLLGTEYEGPDGIFPPPGLMVSIDDWEYQAGRQLGEEDAEDIAGMVSWCLVKWDDLQYDQSTWDTPPPRDSQLYPAYKRALRRYLGGRNVIIPVLGAAECKKRDAVRFAEMEPPSSQPDCVVGGKLMNFQMEGIQWLLTKYYKRESAILADDMGLGKTVQIAALLGYLGSQEIYPCLVVVPNSTITNWVREFEKWVPHMRVVPFYGEAASRKIIREYELYHKGKQGQADGLKAHVVLTTYDMITGKEFRVFKSIPRWEMLVIDEGQKLKSDGSLIFANLQKLTSVHRLLLTGTPLNNNIRELFNLLNFLDPTKFTDRTALEKRFEQDNLNEELVRELHALAQPYILRRIKDDVLRLPPKVEIIVPISLTRTQVEVYKYILESNLERLETAMAERKKRAAQRAKNQPARIEGGGLIVEEPKPNGAEAGDVDMEPAATGTVDGAVDMVGQAGPSGGMEAGV